MTYVSSFIKALKPSWIRRLTGSSSWINLLFDSVPASFKKCKVFRSDQRLELKQKIPFGKMFFSH